MFLFTKRPGERTNVRFMPGCGGLAPLSIGLTIALNLIIRIF